MKRREAIKKTAFVLGYAVSASAVAAVMSGCQADTKTPLDDWKPESFSATQINTIREAAERIVPATDGIVGAKDVMVERFIDEIAKSYKEDEVQFFKENLDQLEADAKAAYNKSFADLENDQMDVMITAIMNRAKGEMESDVPSFFLQLKEMALLGYFTSEKVGEEVLNYDPVPTRYDACIDLSTVKNGRIWSL